MSNDNTVKIVPERFKEMIKKLDELDPLFRSPYFEDENGNPIYGKHPPKHKLRKDKQKDIAEMLGITEQNLSKNVNGSAAPQAKTLLFFQKYYGVFPDWLCGISPNKTVNQFLANAERTDEILRELIELNGIECATIDTLPDATIADGPYRWNVGGTVYSYEDFHRLAVKVKRFVKFELETERLNS